jgi:hypothetical protein
MLAWEEIMSKAPTMKKLVEDKINEEVAKKQVEIDQLKADKQALQDQLDILALEILTLKGV